MAGCGGGSTESTTQVETHRDDQPLPKADYIALGDVICRNHESRTRDLESQTIELGHIDSKGKAHRVAALLRRQTDNLAAEAQELQGLQPPPADVGEVGSILGFLRAKVDVLREWASAYEISTPLRSGRSNCRSAPPPAKPGRQPGRRDSKSVEATEAKTVARLASLPAPWRSGYAAACKAVYTGSIPVGASRRNTW